MKYLQHSIEPTSVEKRMICKGDLEVVLVSCQNLANKDIFSLSDPYVILEFQQTKHRSKIIFDQLNPVWGNKFIFPYYDTVDTSNQETNNNNNNNNENDNNENNENNENILKLAVYDYDILKYDGLF